MDICPTRFPEVKGHMPKNLPQNKHVIEDIGNKCGKVGSYKCKKKGGGWTRGVVMVGMELRQQHGMENSTK